MKKEIIPVPTQTDITTAILITDRILLRQTFEKLINRKESKYFKNITIRDIPWGEITPVPKNFPLEFKIKYPYDFVAEFTTLGCNALKCYKHDYEKPCRGSQPYFINEKFGACSEACYKVYDEFNDFLCEEFKIKIDNKLNDELPFETLSIEKPFPDEGGIEQYFCGIQLVDLKRFAILPASRWNEKFESYSTESPSSTFLTQRSFKDVHENHPSKICDMAGLVDSPPLDWNTETQNINFNQAYCKRFRKEYDAFNDSCYKLAHRKVLDFVIGENIINQASDEELLFPFLMLVDKGGSMALNNGYVEKKISQKKFERAFYNDISDKTIRRKEKISIIKPQKQQEIHVIDVLGHYKDMISNKVTKDIGIAILEIMRSMGEEILIEEGITSSPAITNYLLRYFSRKIVNKASKITHTTKGLINCALRMMITVSRAIVSEVSIQLAIKCITILTSIFNIHWAFVVLLLIPEILLGVYNVGGYNREIDRERINKIRSENVRAILTNINFGGNDDNSSLFQISKSFLAPLSYISITLSDNDDKNNNNNNIISPLITPELIYNMCLVNFHSKFPKYINEIGRTGLNPNEGIELAFEYLSLLKVNSIGQYLYKFDEIDDINITETVDNVMKNEKKTPTSQYFQYSNNDNNSSPSLIPSEILDNSSEIVKKEVDFYCGEYDYESIQWKSQCIGKNHDLVVLILVMFLTFIIGILAYIFSCKYCEYFYENKYNIRFVAGIVIAISFSSLSFWFLIFGKTIENLKKRKNGKIE